MFFLSHAVCCADSIQTHFLAMTLLETTILLLMCTFFFLKINLYTMSALYQLATAICFMVSSSCLKFCWLNGMFKRRLTIKLSRQPFYGCNDGKKKKNIIWLDSVLSVFCKHYSTVYWLFFLKINPRNWSYRRYCVQICQKLIQLTTIAVAICVLCCSLFSTILEWSNCLTPHIWI